MQIYCLIAQAINYGIYTSKRSVCVLKVTKTNTIK